MNRPELNLPLGTFTSIVSTFMEHINRNADATKVFTDCFINGIKGYVPSDSTIKNVHIEYPKYYVYFSADIYLTEYVGYIFTLEIRQFYDDTPVRCELSGYDCTYDTYTRIELRKGNIHEALKSPNFMEAVKYLVKQHEKQAGDK